MAFFSEHVPVTVDSRVTVEILRYILSDSYDALYSGGSRPSDEGRGRSHSDPEIRWGVEGGRGGGGLKTFFGPSGLSLV